jgi:hypothetical protein
MDQLQLRSLRSRGTYKWFTSLQAHAGIFRFKLFLARLMGTSIPDKIPEALLSSVSRVFQVKYAELPEQVKSWIVEHP